jgi:ATP-binding cassette subfamily B protein
MHHSLSPQTAGSFASSLRRVSPYFLCHRWRIASIALLATSAASLSALEPLVLKQLFDAFLEGVDARGALVPFAMLLAMLVSGELLGVLLERAMWKVRLAVDFSLMHATVDRLHSLPLEYHRDQGVGATMTKIERGIAGSMNAFSELAVRLLPAVAYLAVSVFVMFRLSWKLSLAVVLFAPVPALLGVLAVKEQTARERGLMERWTRIFSRFNEVLSGILVVKSFVMEEQEKRRFLNGVSDANGLVLRGVATDTRVNALKNFSIIAARLAALGLGGMLVMRHEISFGTLLAFVSYLGGVFHPVQTLTGMYQTLRKAAVSLEAVLSILEAQDCLGDAPDAREAGAVRGDVEFDRVSFRYRPERLILRELSLHVRAGEMVALVGPSGTGKSTLMALLQRLYDPSAGSIRIDGQDIRTLKQRSLRDQIGVVLQEGSLFSDSVHDNIAFGKPLATRAEVEEAARAANAHEFIVALPQGYDTEVGERGSKLSGGERQRLAIARALLKDAPILVLDEATAALDAESEDKVQEALARLCAGRTTFVIAHRLSTITSADRIVVLRDGTIDAIGDHETLMREGGYYASLVKRQMRGLVVAAA